MYVLPPKRVAGVSETSPIGSCLDHFPSFTFLGASSVLFSLPRLTTPHLFIIPPSLLRPLLSPSFLPLLPPSHRDPLLPALCSVFFFFLCFLLLTFAVFQASPSSIPSGVFSRIYAVVCFPLAPSHPPLLLLFFSPSSFLST